ncbi:MAG: amino acid racemase [Firmicutes bacterium]|nr:amino acid racemase [Bacillota bacterium]
MNKTEELWILSACGPSTHSWNEAMKKRIQELGISCRLFEFDGGKAEFANLIADIDVLPKIVYIRREISSIHDFFRDKSVRVINSFAAQKVIHDKLATHDILAKHGISQPKYLPGTDNVTYENVKMELGDVFVAKSRFSYGGKNCYLISNKSDFDEMIMTLAVAKTPLSYFIFQEYISDSFGKDLRTYVFGYKIADALIRESTDSTEFRSGVSGKCTFTRTDVSEKIANQAIEIARILDGELITVDFMYRKNGDVVFCEANTAPGFRLDGLCEKAMDYVASIIKPTTYVGPTKTIGLLGGMCWPSTVTYYELINRRVNEELGGLSSAKCIINSLDYEELIQPWSKGEWDKSLEVVANAAMALERGGVDFIAMCCNTVHMIYDKLSNLVKTPIIHIMDPVIEKLKEQGISKVALLGTRFTMREDFHKKRLRDAGIMALTPEGADAVTVDKIIYDELVYNKVVSKSKETFKKVINKLVKDGAQAVILACTEIGLLLKNGDASVPIFDTTELHAHYLAGLSIK